MVINTLGFVGRPLYLPLEFFSNKPVDLLIRAGLAAENLNDDSLGRALDELYAQGVTEVFFGGEFCTSMASHIAFIIWTALRLVCTGNMRETTSHRRLPLLTGTPGITVLT